MTRKQRHAVAVATTVLTLAGGTPVHSLRPWVHAIAHHSELAMMASRRAGAEYRDGDIGTEIDADHVQRERLDALVGALLSLPERQRQTPTSGPSRAVTLAGSGALAAKPSGAVLMSAAPVVAVAPVPVAGSAAPPPRHVASARASAGAVESSRRRAIVRVPASVRALVSAPAGSEAPTAVRSQVDHEGERYEHPLEAGHVVPGAPRPEGGVGQSRPGQQEETQQRQDPAAERATQNVAEDPQQEQSEPGGDQRQQSEQTGHPASLASGPQGIVTPTG